MNSTSTTAGSQQAGEPMTLVQLIAAALARVVERLRELIDRAAAAARRIGQQVQQAHLAVDDRIAQAAEQLQQAAATSAPPAREHPAVRLYEAHRRAMQLNPALPR
jgi:alpha-ketoglutarate-dependent taurine dioxygenase